MPMGTCVITSNVSRSRTRIFPSTIELTYTRLREKYRVATVDASGIARAHGIGSKTQPIVNTAILGAFAVYSQIVSLDAVLEAIRNDVPLATEANVTAAEEAAYAVRTAPMLEVQHA